MQPARDVKIFRAQPGAQEMFLRCPADIVLYGGAAGGGKTFGMLLEAARGINNKDYRASCFRRKTTEITAQGGLWDESLKIYSFLGSQTNAQSLRHTFRSGASIQFGHLQHDDDIYAHQGDQITTLLFDELTHFTENQFWYMLSRLRSAAGLTCRCRASTNPDARSWVRKLVEWYLLPNGLPNPKKAGVIRYFLRINEQLYWASARELLVEQHGCKLTDVKSFAFIPATIEDNQILLQNDPSYVSNLLAQSNVERDRLLYGNWNVKAESKVFKQEQFRTFIISPKFSVKIITVDTASKKKEANDYSVLQCWGLGLEGIYLVDQLRGKWMLPELELMFRSFVEKHNDIAMITIEDTGNGTALLQGFQKTFKKPMTPLSRSKDKYSRAYECQSYVASNYVFLNPTAGYYLDFIGEVTAFTADDSHDHDDQVDCMLDAIEKLLINPIPAAKWANEKDMQEMSLSRKTV